ncbi:hypothetical protein D5086_019497 [Populus alba]|uniref:Uncharacterized protein n=2 Tax=Populus alba TaxID=43335 RepID=A0ACC4BHD4_POPAL|nr:hypothetical protein D5086_0000059760 [Populus alba]
MCSACNGRYPLTGDDYSGNRAEDVKPMVGMDGLSLLLAVSFNGDFGLVELRKFMIIIDDFHTYAGAHLAEKQIFIYSPFTHRVQIYSSSPLMLTFPAFAEANLAIDMYMFVRTVASYFSGVEETGCAGLRRLSLEVSSTKMGVCDQLLFIRGQLEICDPVSCLIFYHDNLLRHGCSIDLL